MPDGDLEYIDPFPGRKGSERVRSECTKCRGRGRLSTIVDGGRCWACGGSGTVSVLVSSARARERRRARQAAEKAAAAAKRSDDLDKALSAAQDALRPVLGVLVDTVLESGRDGRPFEWEQMRPNVRGILYDVRDGYRSPEDAIGYVHDYRCGDVFDTNRYRGRCVACGATVNAGAGATLRVGSTWHALCPQHRPEPGVSAGCHAGLVDDDGPRPVDGRSI